jgi:hypothetical protein
VCPCLSVALVFYVLIKTKQRGYYAPSAPPNFVDRTKPEMPNR